MVERLIDYRPVRAPRAISPMATENGVWKIVLSIRTNTVGAGRVWQEAECHSLCNIPLLIAMLMISIT